MSSYLPSFHCPVATTLALILVGLSICGGVLIFLFVSHRVKQLTLRSIPGPPSLSIFQGNSGQMFHAGASSFYEHILKTYGTVIRFSAILGDTQLLIADPRACTSILLKDQDAFEEAPWSLETVRHVFGFGLFATMGAHHRKQRKMLNSVFSSKHMRSMTPFFQNITQQISSVAAEKVQV